MNDKTENLFLTVHSKKAFLHSFSKYCNGYPSLKCQMKKKYLQINKDKKILAQYRHTQMKTLFLYSFTVLK